MDNGKSSNMGGKLCILALGAYPLLAATKTKNIEGPDVHQIILAKEFLKNGINVSVIAYADEGAPIEYIDGIEIIKIRKTAYRLKLLNIFVKFFQICYAMWKANSPIYFQAGGFPCIISIFCLLVGRKYIHENASDASVDRKLVIRKNKQFSRSLLKIGTICNWINIKLADAIIVQSKNQLIILKKNFSRDGILIKMAFPKNRMYKKANPPIILWVGSMAEVKQPELFVELAKAVPEARFRMIGGHSGDREELHNAIKSASENMSNLELLGVVSFNDIEKHFGRASILVNTSMFEGFPNAFIQAWMHHVPVISLNADPDNIICNNKLGFHSKTFEKMIEDLRSLLNNEELRKEMGRNAAEYAEKEHNIDLSINKYIKIFNKFYLIKA